MHKGLPVHLYALIIVLSLCLPISAANTETVKNSTVTSTVTLSSAVDYVLGSTTPFSGSGCVNITNTDHAVVVFKNIKPSVVISTWLKYIKVNGSAASDGTNCQVKMYGKYGHGTIVLPYSSSMAPLTCYSGQNYTGTSCNSYTTGSDGGYMKTLTSSQLPNGIRSFKLKRGYMVTFATGVSGWGYSRCFIADTEDLEVSSLPAVFDGKISSYRLFVWYDAQKKGVGGDSGTDVTGATNSSWSFTWSQGYSQLPDVDFVPHKIQRWWPGNSTIGAAEYSAHAKTDNEPANSSDDNPATYSEVLSYWEDLMRTGQRLCSPSTYDGSNNAEWFNNFFAQIDAKGWRCDIFDRHCYWTSFSQLATDYSTYGRPIWISELMWGASWNSNGIFGAVSDASSSSSSNQTALYNGAKPIVDALNGYGYVERYAWWNSENVASKIYYNSALTTFGEYYAEMVTGLAYNKSYEYVPKVVVQTPVITAATVVDNQCTIKWAETNGDIVDAIKVQYSTDGTAWTDLATITPQDKSASGNVTYSYEFALTDNSPQIRIVETFDGTDYVSSAVGIVRSSGWITALPVNYEDFYYLIYSEEATSDLCWTLGWNGNLTDISYQTPEEIGSRLDQVWQIEANSSSDGYSLRNLAASDFVMCSPNSWNFTTNNSSYHTSAAKTGYLPEYVSDGYWTIKNCGHTDCYVGLWDNDKTFAVGERLAANRNSQTSADHLKIYAIKKAEFNQAYVNHGHSDFAHVIRNQQFTWGTTSASVSGSGANSIPVDWTFNKTFSGWNDSNVATETINGIETYRFNTWAGTFTYAELQQTLTNLPNGIYKVSADLATTDDYTRTQTMTAIYGNPAIADSVARSYNIIGTGVSDFNHYDCYVAVDKNQLTIGARSDGTWFKVANFALEYICEKDEATEEVLGYIDNGRALQAIAWSMDKGYFDLSKYTNCRNLQIDQTPVNAFVRMAATATADTDFRSQNVIIGNECQQVVLTDGEPLVIEGDSFTAANATYKTSDSEWSVSGATFPSANVSALTTGDSNHDGSISIDDVSVMASVVAGHTKADGLATLLNNIRTDANGRISISQLTELIRQINQ